MGLRPMASASFPNEADSSTSAKAEAEPMRPSSRATFAGERPASRIADGRAVPMQPKHADCKPAMSISSATGGSSSIAAASSSGGSAAAAVSISDRCLFAVGSWLCWVRPRMQLSDRQRAVHASVATRSVKRGHMTPGGLALRRLRAHGQPSTNLGARPVTGTGIFLNHGQDTRALTHSLTHSPTHALTHAHKPTSPAGPAQRPPLCGKGNDL